MSWLHDEIAQRNRLEQFGDAFWSGLKDEIFKTLHEFDDADKGVWAAAATYTVQESPDGMALEIGIPEGDSPATTGFVSHSLGSDRLRAEVKRRDSFETTTLFDIVFRPLDSAADVESELPAEFEAWDQVNRHQQTPTRVSETFLRACLFGWE